MGQASDTEPGKIYRVLFRGVILPGFAKEDVVKNVHEITRIPEDVISRKFFSGKTVVIRRADSQEYAYRLQKTFARAGIETYIEEILVEQNNSTSQPLSDRQEKNEPDSSSKLLLTISLSGLLLIVISIAYFSGAFELTESASKLNKPVTQSSDKSIASGKKVSENKKITDPLPGKTAINKTKSATGVKVPASKTEQVTQLALLFEPKDIRQLVKITHPAQLKRFEQFIHLFDFTKEQKEAIHLLLQQEIHISQKQPLILLESEKNSLLYLTADISSAVMASFNSLLNHTAYYSQISCSSVQQLKLIINNKQLLISNFNTDEDDFFAALDNSLQNLHSLYEVQPALENSQFYLYSNTETYPAFKLLVSDKQFVFSGITKAKENKNTLTNSVQVKLNSIENLSEQHHNLFDLALLYISLNSLQDTTIEQPFTPQLTSTLTRKTIQANPVNPQIATYKQELDIDFVPQWQSGPFALSTASLQFENNTPIIEIQAKGQNIHPFIEYSPMAKLSTTRVLDKNNRNVLLSDCHRQPDSRLFENIDGEQEAFINNDFVSFKTISAKTQLQLKPSISLSDIKEVEGEIILYYPQKTFSKQITLSDNSHVKKGTIVLADFIFQYHLSGNSLNYHIIGDTAQFIAVRAYDADNTINNTRYFQFNERYNRNLLSIKHIFEHDIKQFVIFYSRDYQSKHYTYKIKPQISAAQNLSEPLTDEQPVALANEQLDIVLLSEEIRADNPSWLGEKLASTLTPPFYINLFKQTSDDQTLTDIIVNIKLALTPVLHHNISATRLKLYNNDKPVLDDFIHFTHKTLAETQQDYLDSSITLQIPDSELKLRGKISLNLPREFITKNSPFQVPGQVIDMGSVRLQFTKQSARELQLTIYGDLDTLVQVKVYDKNKILISDLMEYKRLDKHHGQLSLMYYGDPGSITIITGQNILTKTYDFAL